MVYGLAFADRNPFLDMMWSAFQAFNSALDGIVVQGGTVANTCTYGATGYVLPQVATTSVVAQLSILRVWRTDTDRIISLSESIINFSDSGRA
jgi:hypothetical protein